VLGGLHRQEGRKEVEKAQEARETEAGGEKNLFKMLNMMSEQPTNATYNY
jgi:hypothetical protein